MARRIGFWLSVPCPVLGLVGVLDCTGHVTQPPPPQCNGTALNGDPSGRPACAQPQSPIGPCTSPITTVTQTTLSAPATLEAEVMTAIDPRPNRQFVYAATTEATVTPSSGPTQKCIIAKRIRVWRSENLGGAWKEMPGSPSLPQGQYVADPEISVGGDGTVFVTFVRTVPSPDCANFVPFNPMEVQLWFAPPGETAGQTLQPALPSVPTRFGDTAPSIAQSAQIVDHPQIAASPVVNGRQQVSVYVAQVGASDFVATFERNGALWTERGSFSVPGSLTFTNLSYDLDGDLYVAIGTSRSVERRLWTGRSGKCGRCRWSAREHRRSPAELPTCTR